MSDVVGSASFELRASRDKLKQDIAAAERDLQVGVANAEKNVSGGAKGMGGAIAGIGASAAAVITTVLAVVAAVGLAVKAGFDLSFSAIRYADDIANTAKRIGVGTDALQEWRFVAKKTGEDAAAADKAIDSFATKLAQATAGTSKEAMKGFSLLRVGPEQLRAYSSTEAALDDITDRIKDLRSEAERAAVIEALGLGPLSAALRDGSTDVAALRDEARALGIVMDDELIKRASKAQEEFDTLSQVIDVNLKTAFADLAPVLITAIGLIADAVRQLSLFVDKFRELENKTAIGLAEERRILVADRDAIAAQFGTGRLDGRPVRGRRVTGGTYDAPTPYVRPFGVGLPSLPSRGLGRDGNVILDAGEQFDNAQRRIAQIDAELAERRRQSAGPLRSDRPTGSSISLPTGRTPRASIDRSAEREARRAERVEQDIFRAKQRLLQVAEGDLLNAQERADLARHIVNDERAARDAQIASQAARGEINAAELEQLNLANEQADILEDQIMRENALRDVLDEEVANRNALADLTANLVSLQIGAVRTAQERQRLELDLLAITQRQRRDRLELELNNNPALSDGERQQRWDLNTQIEEMERQAVARANLSPLQQWRDEALKSAAEVSEAYESIAARGLDALNDGIVDAIMGTKSLGEVFSQVAKQILADLLSISVRRGITEPLAAALFGGGQTGGKGGGGGWIMSLAKGAASIFGGGSPAAGLALPDVVGKGLSMNAGPGAAKQLSLIQIAVEEGAMFVPRVRQVAGPMVEIGKSQAIRASADIARRSAPSVQNRQRKLGTT